MIINYHIENLFFMREFAVFYRDLQMIAEI